MFDLKRMALHDVGGLLPTSLLIFLSPLFLPHHSWVWVFDLPLGNMASEARTERLSDQPLNCGVVFPE